MALRGIQLLKEQDVEHEILTYRFVKGARAAADSLDVPHEIVVKSLIFRGDDGSVASRCTTDDRLSSQRIDTLDEIQAATSAWEKRRDNAESRIDWYFTSDDARIKLKRLYPALKM